MNVLSDDEWGDDAWGGDEWGDDEWVILALQAVIEDMQYNGEVKYVQYVKGNVMCVSDLFKVTCLY